MSIFTKLKTAADFSASVIKEGFALIWPEQKEDGSISLQVKLNDGSIKEIGGGSDIDTNAMVRIYDATVESSTGVVTITDGTPVADLAIGDEIRTPDGVYQKIKDNITTTGSADGTRIEVSGITNPADANGYYALQSANLWKHETANYWITLFSGLYWMISDKSAPASPGECIFFATMTGPEVVKPWEIDTNWDPMNDSVGDPQVENAGVLTTVSNTIDLFEYAAFPEDGAKTSDITDAIETHNQDSSAHPDKLPLSGGQMTGELKLGSSNGIRFNNADGYGVIFRKDASNFYIMITAQNDENGFWTTSRPLQLNFATSECNINGGAVKDGKGNVIATTYAPLNHPTFSNGIELTGTTPFIDFHHNNSESDYTFRIVQNTADTLTLGGKVVVTNTLTVGGMSVNGNIKNTGEIQSETTNSFRLIHGDYGTFWRNDGRDLYLMLTDSGDQYGVYNSLRPLTVDLPTGVCDISGSALETETNLANTGIYPSASMNTTQTSDFDDFLTQGVYWFPNGVHPNGPLGDDAYCTGMLCVYNVQNTNYVQVFYMRTGTGEGNHIMYYRWQYSGTWTNWMTISGNNELATGVNDYNAVTSPGSYYFSYGDNSSNVNAPANGPFHLIVHKYYNAAGTTNRILQIAIPHIVSTGQTATVYIRTATWSNDAYTWQPWTKLVTEDILEAVGIYPTSSIAPNLNFNTALTQGYYFANGASCTNGPFAPSTSQGWVSVRTIPGGNNALQLYQSFNTNDLFIRRYTGNAWADWRQIVTNGACTPEVGIAVDCTSALKSSAGYTCPSNGWIYADGTSINVNGRAFYTSRLPMVPVLSGDVVKCSFATIGEFYAAR